MPPTPPKSPAHITVVETVYHQPSGSPGTASECRYQRDVRSDEHPYTYFPTLTEEWQPVDLGWLKGAGVGMLVVENRPAARPRHPTQEEKTADAEAVIEVGLPLFAIILPGESCRFHPHPALIGRMQLRCRKGTCKARVTVLPS